MAREECECARPAKVRRLIDGAWEWRCYACRRPLAPAARPSAELDALHDRAHPLTTWAELVGEFGEPDHVTVHERREPGASTLSAEPERAREGHWKLGGGAYALTVWEYVDGSIRHALFELE